jgi:hypothetical protein
MWPAVGGIDPESAPPLRSLSGWRVCVSSPAVKEKSNVWLPVALMMAFALTRWPGLLPQNFSAAYALVFCAGVFLPGRLAWWLPLGTILASDLALNLYYYYALNIAAFKVTQLVNYAVYAGIIWFGTRFNPHAHFAKLLGGGILGAIVFYFVTNTAAWFFNPFGNPEYTKTLAGWITALTKGTAGYAQTWEFFRNTLLSGGLFTGLFVGAMKLTRDSESSREKEEVRDAAENPETEPSADSKPEEAQA